MRWAIGLAAVIAALMLLPLGTARAITNGSYDGDDHPNVGIMYFRELPAFAWCSGTLLSKHEFLTAAHCTAGLDAFGLSPADIAISFDEEIGLTPEGVLFAEHPIAVTGWVTHPAFKAPPGGGLNRNDVGVIHLAEDVDIDPIELPPAGFLDTQSKAGALKGFQFVDVGYGYNALDRSWLSPQANTAWEHRRMATESAFSALNPDHLRIAGGVCIGDSGGPQFFGAGSNLVVSINSTGNAVCNQAAPQRLDIEVVLDFLAPYR